MKKSLLSFTEVCGNADVKSFSDSIFRNLLFPISGKLSCDIEGNNRYGQKGVYCESEDLIDIETALSFIMARKNEKWDASFYIAQTLGIQLIVRVNAKEEAENLSLYIYELSENNLDEGIMLLPLVLANDSFPQISFNLLDVEKYPENPGTSYYNVHAFNQQALSGSLYVSPDGKVMFHQKTDGEYERIWSKSLPNSINRFLNNKILKGVLSQAIIEGWFVSLLEDGKIHMVGSTITRKNGISKDAYEYLILLAENQYKGENIHTELTPCLIYE